MHKSTLYFQIQIENNIARYIISTIQFCSDQNKTLEIFYILITIDNFLIFVMMNFQ